MSDYPDYQVPVTIVSIAPITVTVAGNVTVTNIVDITGTVTVNNTVTITGVVTVTSGAVTISTVALNNIIIDKLTTEAYLETRRTLSNWTDTGGGGSLTTDQRMGKFFPRGCRGFIEKIKVRLSNAYAGDTVNVYVAAFPTGAVIQSSTITLAGGSTSGFYPATFNKMWNYDSMFIFIKTNSSDTIVYSNPSSIADDDWISYDAGANWIIDASRMGVEVYLAAQTIGDVPTVGHVIISDILAITGTVTVTGTVASTQSGTWTVAVSGSVTVTGAVTVTGTVAVSGTVTVSGTVAISGSVTVTGSVTVSGTVAISGTVTVSGAVTVTGSVTVSGTVAVSGTVTISGAVTVTSGSITVAGAVTVSTYVGTNIIIDKLVQSAYVSRSDALYNPYPATPPSFFTNAYYRSKYYPRGCRGYINNIQIRAKNTGVQTTMDFGVAPSIGGVDVFTFTATIPAGADGSANIQTDIFKPWDSDSMFIHTKTLGTASLGLGYDEIASTDGFYSTDLVSWTPEASRAYITVAIVGMSVGDIPVAGIVRLGDRSSYRPSHITADTQIKASAGRIHTVTINKCTTAGVLTIYDNTAESGTVIAAITIPINAVPVTLTYDVLTTTGIYAGFDATLVADITVSYL